MSKKNRNVGGGVKTGAAATASVDAKSASVRGSFNVDVAELTKDVTFPVQIFVKNDTPTLLVESELGVVLQPYTSGEFTARNAEKLQRAASNFEQLCFINNWTDGVLLSLEAFDEEGDECGKDGESDPPKGD